MCMKFHLTPSLPKTTETYWSELLTCLDFGPSPVIYKMRITVCIGKNTDWEIGNLTSFNSATILHSCVVLGKSFNLYELLVDSF